MTATLSIPPDRWRCGGLVCPVQTAKNRRERAKNGYRQNSMVWDYLKAGIIAALILYYCYLLSQYRGISVMLVWVVAICLIYNFITAKTASAVTSTRWAATRKPPSSPVSTPIRSTSSPTPTWACWPACAACSMPPAWVPSTAPPVPPLRWTPSAPASSAALPLTAVAAPVGGVVIGALLLGVINMGMSILGIGDSWQYVVKGGVLLVAVIFDVVTSRKSGK